MKKIILTAILLLSTIIASAYDFVINGIYYNKNGTTATVTYKNNNYNSYSGDVFIPETVTNGGTTYTVTSIGSSAFYSCTGLTSVTIPKSITQIGQQAFSDCSNLDRVYISDLEAWCNIYFEFNYWGSNPCYYAHHLFLNGIEITHLVIPSSISYIRAGSFFGCSFLKEITFPNTVSIIGSNAFGFCSGLTNISIPSSVSDIYANPFIGCSGIESITIESGNLKYNSNNNCNAIIETSSNKLIAGCKNTIIPSFVTTINNEAFYGLTSLSSVIIPSSVTFIGGAAFDYCDSLMDVYCYNPNPPETPQYSSVFYYIKANRTLHVPVGSVPKYSTDWNWYNYFESIVEMEPDTVNHGDVNGDDKINISDVTTLIDFLLSDDDSHINRINSDVNGDSKINISDVTTLIDMLLRGTY